MGFSLGGFAAACVSAASACIGGGDANAPASNLSSPVSYSFASATGHDAPSQGTEVTIAPAPGPSI